MLYLIGARVYERNNESENLFPTLSSLDILTPESSYHFSSAVMQNETTYSQSFSFLFVSGCWSCSGKRQTFQQISSLPSFWLESRSFTLL